MKNRFPRKLKKRAKKLKAAADAMLTAKAALITTMGMSQVAIISAQPIPFGNRLFHAHKALSIAQVSINTAQGIQRCLSEIKSWQEFARWK